MKNCDFVFNRVLGLKFLHDFFPYLFNKERIALYFANSKEELFKLNFDDKDYNTLVLKRSGNSNAYLSDIMCKDNRFFNSLSSLKEGAKEFEDRFDFCVECHKFKKGEEYYSDRLAIAQFSTKSEFDGGDKISFIPSRKPGVSTRDNHAYLSVDFPFNSGNIFHINKINKDEIEQNNLNNFDIAFLVTEIHRMIDSIRELLIEFNCFNDFQLIIRFDSYLNLLPVDFRTPEAWTNLK